MYPPRRNIQEVPWGEDHFIHASLRKVWELCKIRCAPVHFAVSRRRMGMVVEVHVFAISGSAEKVAPKAAKNGHKVSGSIVVGCSHNAAHAKAAMDTFCLSRIHDEEALLCMRSESRKVSAQEWGFVAVHPKVVVCFGVGEIGSFCLLCDAIPLRKGHPLVLDRRLPPWWLVAATLEVHEVIVLAVLCEIRFAAQGFLEILVVPPLVYGSVYRRHPLNNERHLRLAIGLGLVALTLEIKATKAGKVPWRDVRCVRVPITRHVQYRELHWVVRGRLWWTVWRRESSTTRHGMPPAPIFSFGALLCRRTTPAIGAISRPAPPEPLGKRAQCREGHAGGKSLRR
mmetsp:Transcript_8876/g.25324  ORF Transcript_8876/g.25324 Transcript_8876/m.25324 type:complete len:341 (-) Transcript_8876:240-1262(-)